MTVFATGDIVRLVHDVDRYPHFIAPGGALGIVTDCDEDIVAVRLVDSLPGSEEWNNEVHWYPPNGDDPSQDIVHVHGA